MSGKYRIIEKIYEDGHSEFTAQEAETIFGLPIYWKKYVLKEEDYYGNTVRWICCGETYDDCLQQLRENLIDKEKARKKNTVKSTIYHEARV